MTQYKAIVPYVRRAVERLQSLQDVSTLSHKLDPGDGEPLQISKMSRVAPKVASVCLN